MMIFIFGYCFLALDIARGVSSVEIGIGVSAPSIFIDTSIKIAIKIDASIFIAIFIDEDAVSA
jgi:hypothetical protein